MRLVRRTSQFKSDVKRQVKRGKDLSALRKLIEQLVQHGSLAANYHDHPLVGGYNGARECHIETNWLLIYEINQEELILIRTGTHSDLFE